MNAVNQEKQDWLACLINHALEEDMGTGDVTTNSIIGDQKKARAVWIAKQDGVIAGLNVAKTVFRQLDEQITWMPKVDDGDFVKSGQILVEFEGNGKAILSAERVALNFAQRMSGIATKTAKMADVLKGYPVKILDTRKTVPGLRQLDKIAVKTGGGYNHRMGLYDMALVKENHIRVAGGIKKAVDTIRGLYPDVKIEVEATTLKEVNEALRAGSDMIMLDNMDIETMRVAVKRINKQAETEASGNMSIGRLREVAETGVDFISVGVLTHSVEALDISQQIIEIL